MGLSHTHIAGFRLILIISLLLILLLAMIELDHPVINSVNDKLGHVMAFVYLAFVLDFSIPDSQFNLLKIIPLLGYGLLIEIIQYFLPYRTFSLFDFLADGAGIVLYILVIPLLRHIPLLRLRWADIKAERSGT